MSPGKNQRVGVLTAGIGGLALSFDIPLMRLGDGDIWSVLALRSLCTFVVALIVWWVLRRLMGHAITLIPGRAGLVAGLFYCANTVTFLLAVFNTSTANVVFIFAFTSMFAAGLSWLFLKQKPSGSTLLTMGAMIGGIWLIVSDGLESGSLFGDAMALAAALCLAAALTISEASGKDMGLVPLVTSIVPAILGFLLMPAAGLAINDPSWVIFDGTIMVPLAFFCLATAPRFLSGPEVGMFYLLETVLAPVWVWLLFAEQPTSRTLAGGAILILALTLHSAWQIRHMPKTVTTT